jgi:hypothetical protein
MLEAVCHQHARLAPEHAFRAVAAMHVEVGDGHALETMHGQRVRDADRCIAVDAEAHGVAGARVVTRRPGGAEHAARAPAHHQIDRMHHGPGCARCRGKRAGRHDGVGIQPVQPALRRHPLDFVQIGRVMHAFELFARRQRCVCAAPRAHQP